MRALVAGNSHCGGYEEAAVTCDHTPVEFAFRLIGVSNAFHSCFHDVYGGYISFHHDIFYLESVAHSLPCIPLALRGKPFDWYGFSGPLGIEDVYMNAQLFNDGQLAISRSLLRQTVIDRNSSVVRFPASSATIETACFRHRVAGAVSLLPKRGTRTAFRRA